MNPPTQEKPRDFEKEFNDTINRWRESHKLAENDAVVLLMELFRIHQRHWDEIRRREMPSLTQYHTDIAQLNEAAKSFTEQSSELIKTLAGQPSATAVVKVTLTAAVFAALACLLAGYLIGKAW